MSKEATPVAPVQNFVLLPCPFCGGTARLWGHDVQCQTDGCFVSQGTGYDYDEQEDAVNAWNQRVDREDAEKWRAMQRSFARPDQMRTDVSPVWDPRNVGQ